MQKRWNTPGILSSNDQGGPDCLCGACKTVMARFYRGPDGRSIGESFDGRLHDLTTESGNRSFTEACRNWTCKCDDIIK